jgi:predicted Rossmann-fold nucleotide-binding protein
MNEKNISPEDLNLIQLVDTADAAAKVIEDFYGKYLLQPNF